MRLIDADKINFQWAPLAPFDINNMHCEPVALECEIDEQPTIDAVPVVHAHWIKADEGHESFYDNTWVEYLVLHCSSCNGMVREGEKSRYCPFCGAKMDEEEGE